MILQKIAKSIRQQDWFVVVVELLVVVIGLIMAFQVDRWRETLDERRQEQGYIERLTADIESDIPAIQFAVDMQSIRFDFVELLMATMEDPEAAVKRPAEFLAAVDQAAFTYTPVLASHTFEDLRSTGNMRLISSQELKEALFNYYGFDKAQWQYRPLQFTTEFKHFEQVAGVLSFDQARFVQDKIKMVSPSNQEEVRNMSVDTVAVLLAAKRLAERPGVRDWLPYIRSLQNDQITVHNMRIERAQVVLEILTRHTN